MKIGPQSLRILLELQFKMDQTTALNIFTDGGARGNPGPAAYGFVIRNEQGEILAEVGRTIGHATNNIAEYTAIEKAWKWIAENKDSLPHLRKINFLMDSNLAVSQLNGLYKIKNPNLREILFKIKVIEQELAVPSFYSHIPREENKEADKLVNMALDNEPKE